MKLNDFLSSLNQQPQRFHLITGEQGSGKSYSLSVLEGEKFNDSYENELYVKLGEYEDKLRLSIVFNELIENHIELNSRIKEKLKELSIFINDSLKAIFPNYVFGAVVNDFNIILFTNNIDALDENVLKQHYSSIQPHIKRVIHLLFSAYTVKNSCIIRDDVDFNLNASAFPVLWKILNTKLTENNSKLIVTSRNKDVVKHFATEFVDSCMIHRLVCSALGSNHGQRIVTSLTAEEYLSVVGIM